MISVVQAPVLVAPIENGSVVNDMDVAEDVQIPYAGREEYLAKIEKRVREYDVEVSVIANEGNVEFLVFLKGYRTVLFAGRKVNMKSVLNRRLRSHNPLEVTSAPSDITLYTLCG